MPYEEYFNAASEGLIIVDRSGRIVETNPSAGRLFGYAQPELVGQPIELLVPERLRKLHGEHVAGYFAAPRSRPMGRGLRLVARRKDGSEFPIEISLTYARGTPRADLVVASVVDISERLILEQELCRTETLSSLGALAAGIAHDLNNPLQVIRSRSELLLESPDAATASEMREDQATIYRQAQRATAIVDEFLQLSQRREMIFAPVDINGLVDRALRLVGDQMRKTGINLETHLDPSLPTIMGDAIALERVLINLLTNARDAMPQGGQVVIASSLVTAQQPWVYLTVLDSGPGIHPDALGKVFDLLYTTKPGGSGLGLWLSRRIIQEHNGKIEVQSKLGEGATFTVKLPAGDSSGA